MRKSLRSAFLFLCVVVIGTLIGTMPRGSFNTLDSIQIIPQDIPPEIQFMFQVEKSSLDYSISTRDCLPQKNVFFLKTHKTASTTLQNIILRHAERVNSFVGLTATKEPNLQYMRGKFFQRNFLRPTNQTINMLCNHMRFNRSEVAAVLPNNSVYVTILREPVSHFQSTFNYFYSICADFANVPQSTEGLKKWIHSPQKYFHGPSPTHHWWQAKNAMFYDLGFNSLTDDDDVINDAIEDMRRTYDLVLITEYFDESLILLKELLCMDLRDLAHLQLNSRSKSNTQLDEMTREKIKKWNKANTMIYKAFNKTFWKKIEEFGKERMQREVLKLRLLSVELQAECIDGEGMVSQRVRNQKNRPNSAQVIYINRYNLKESSKNNKTCQNAIRPGKKWYLYLLQKQYQRRPA